MHAYIRIYSNAIAVVAIYRHSAEGVASYLAVIMIIWDQGCLRDALGDGMQHSYTAIILAAGVGLLN